MKGGAAQGGGLKLLHERFCGHCSCQSQRNGEDGDGGEGGGESEGQGKGHAATAGGAAVPAFGQFQVPLQDGDRALRLELWRRKGGGGAWFGSRDDQMLGAVELPLATLRSLALGDEDGEDGGKDKGS